MRRALPLVLAAALSALGGCGGASSEPFVDPGAVAAPNNPEGVAYPADHIGTRSRTRSRPGDRLANFAFQGYVSGDPARGLTTVSMADFYDPGQRRHRVLHLQGVAGWCPICAQEARQTQAAAAALKAEGAIVVQILIEGRTRDSRPSLDDLTKWCSTYQAAHPVLLDPDAARLGAFGLDGYPWNALVDTRTMEILDQGVGAPRDVTAYVREGIRLAALPAATWID